MLRLTARYADAWNAAWYGLPDERLAERLAGMNAALDANGRDPASLRRTVGVDSDVDTVDEIARTIDAYERLGIDDLLIRLEPSTQTALDRLARAIEIH